VKCDRIVHHVNVGRFTESDLMSYFQGGYDVISCRKVLPSAECTCSSVRQAVR